MSESKVEKSSEYTYLDHEIRPEEKSVETARKGAGYVLESIDKFEELNAKTEEEGNNKFIEKVRELWGGNLVTHKTPDLDAKSGIGIFKLAGVSAKNIEFVAKGDFVDGKINIDTGNQHGFTIEYEGKTIFMDHHTLYSGSDTSATKIAYEVLTSLGLLKKEDYLDKLVEFVTQADNKTFPDQGKYFKSSMLTVLGLERYIKFNNLLRFFKDGRSVTELLSSDDLEKYELLDGASKQKEIVDSSLATLKEMDRDGLIINSPRYGKIAVDLDKKVSGGFDAANYYGCGAYIIWSPKTNGFFITAINKHLEDSFSQGHKVRDTMWIKNSNQDPSPLLISLSEILNKLTDNNLNPTGKLADYLLREKSIYNNIEGIKTPAINDMSSEIPEFEPKPTTEQEESESPVLESANIDIFQPYLEELEEDRVDGKLNSEEFLGKKSLITEASRSKNPIEFIEEARVDGKLSSEEFHKLQDLLKGVDKPQPEKTLDEPEESKLLESEANENLIRIPPEAEEAIKPQKLRYQEINIEITEIKRKLHEEIIQGWNNVQKIHEERRELEEERARLIDEVGEENLKDKEFNLSEVELTKTEGPLPKLAEAERKLSEINKLIEQKEDEYNRGGESTTIIDRQPEEKRLKKEIKNLKEQKKEVERNKKELTQGFGKDFKDETAESFKEASAEVKAQEKKESKDQAFGIWKWVKERIRSLGPIGEYLQARKFKRGTELAANDIEALSILIKREKNLDKDEAFQEAQKIWKVMEENNIETITAPEILEISNQITAEKAEENERTINKIIEDAKENLKSNLAKYRGQATSETVLTPEKLIAMENELKLELMKMRAGIEIEDLNDFAKVIRYHLDGKWWLRYVYAGTEIGILSYIGYHFLNPRIPSPWNEETIAIPDASDIELPQNVTPELSKLSSDQRLMEKNLWVESKEILKEVGIDNPTDQQILEVDKTLSLENNVKVIDPNTGNAIWPETEEGQVIDRNMIKGLVKCSKAINIAIKIASGLM